MEAQCLHPNYPLPQKTCLPPLSPQSLDQNWGQARDLGVVMSTRLFFLSSLWATEEPCTVSGSLISTDWLVVEEWKP